MIFSMVRKLRKSLKSPLKRVFKTEDSKFIALVGLKVTVISFGITVFMHWCIFVIMRLNYIFFKAHGLPLYFGGEPFFDILVQEALDSLPFLFIFHIALFFIGSYVGWLMLRPFRLIGEYAEKVMDDPNVIFQVEQFSNYSLLTRFSELFFDYLRESRKRKELISHSIPPQYSRIHKPVFDKVFMLHFSLLLVIISITSAYFIIENSSSIYLSMVELATKALDNQKSVSRFFGSQLFILDYIVALTICLISLCYILLGVHLYTKVAGAAFGIFSTMRSFMKGNYSSRVHLLGFAYIRDYTRKLNKYLDYIQNNFTKDHSKK